MDTQTIPTRARWRFTVADYYRMGELGIFTPTDRTEFLDGEIRNRDDATPWRFTVDDYYRMGDAGILAPDARTELLDGEIVLMSPIGNRHAACVNRNTTALFGVLHGEAMVSIQNPVRLGERSEPVPDVMLARPKLDYYVSGHPTPLDVLLLIEVSDTTLADDLRVKIPLYARAGIAEVWVEDVTADRIIVHRDPTPDGYRSVVSYGRGEQISPSLLPDVVLAVTDLLP